MMSVPAAVLSLETTTILVQLFRARSTSIGSNGFQRAASGLIHPSVRQIGMCRGNLELSASRGSVAEPAAEADRGRHFGFAGVNVFPGGPGSLA
jgi:hypothetical protein